MTRKIGQALSGAALLLLIGALFCGLDGPAYWATTVNDWALDKQYASARAGADLPLSELVYRRHMMTSAFNGGGCLAGVRYIFTTELPQVEFMAAYADVPPVFRPTWLDPEEFQTDYRADLAAEEVAIIEAALAAGKQVVYYDFADLVDYGMLRNGLDPRCGNFD